MKTYKYTHTHTHRPDKLFSYLIPRRDASCKHHVPAKVITFGSERSRRRRTERQTRSLRGSVSSSATTTLPPSTLFSFLLHDTLTNGRPTPRHLYPSAPLPLPRQGSSYLIQAQSRRETAANVHLSGQSMLVGVPEH